jgi:xanthine dehydrogenase accessory factor
MKLVQGPSPASDAVFREAADALAGRRPFCLCTVVATRGSAPQVIGARMVVYPAGELVGTIGGGQIEWTVIQDARRRLAEGDGAGLLDVDLADLGMTCGGHMTVFVDVLGSRERLIVFGAGHVARALAPAAAALDFHVVVVDDRPEWADPAAFPARVEVVAQPFATYLDAYVPGPNDYVVVVTRGHEHDEAVLRGLLSAPVAYLGMMGSRRKVGLIRKRLLAEGVAPEVLERVDAPIGLAIGAVTPAELAVSICGGLVARRRGVVAPGDRGATGNDAGEA